MAKRKKLITYLIERHSAKCWYFNQRTSESGRVPWVCPESTGVTPLGHKRRKWLYVFRCNCPECPAKLGVSDKAAHQIWSELLAPFRKKGAPKRERKLAAAEQP